MVNAVHRSHWIIDLLADNLFDGLATGKIAEAMGTSSANASRDLHFLAGLGYVHKKSGRWTLTDHLLQKMRVYVTSYDEMENARRRIAKIKTEQG